LLYQRYSFFTSLDTIKQIFELADQIQPFVSTLQLSHFFNERATLPRSSKMMISRSVRLGEPEPHGESCAYPIVSVPFSDANSKSSGEVEMDFL
jgi:hypothetical protein